MKKTSNNLRDNSAVGPLTKQAISLCRAIHAIHNSALDLVSEIPESARDGELERRLLSAVAESGERMMQVTDRLLRWSEAPPDV